MIDQSDDDEIVDGIGAGSLEQLYRATGFDDGTEEEPMIVRHATDLAIRHTSEYRQMTRELDSCLPDGKNRRYTDISLPSGGFYCQDDAPRLHR